MKIKLTLIVFFHLFLVVFFGVTMLKEHYLTSFNEGKLKNNFYNFNNTFGIKLKNDINNLAISKPIEDNERALPPFFTREFAKQGYFLDSLNFNNDCIFSNTNGIKCKIYNYDLPATGSLGRQLPFKVIPKPNNSLTTSPLRNTSIKPSVFPCHKTKNTVFIEIPYLEEGSHAVFLATLDSILTIGQTYEHLKLRLSSANRYHLDDMIAIINQLASSKNILICKTQSSVSSVKKHFTNGKPFAQFESIEVVVDESQHTISTSLFCNLLENMNRPNLQLPASSKSSLNMIGYLKFPWNEKVYKSVPAFLIANAKNQCFLEQETFDRLKPDLKTNIDFQIIE